MKPQDGLSKFISTGSAEAILHELEQQKLRLQQNFHAYQEIAALPATDRDALFKLLYAARSGDGASLDAIQTLVYDERPVPMDEFILSRRYLDLQGKINQEKVDIMVEYDKPSVRKAWVAAGSGGGKSFMVSIAMSRMVYRLMCLKRPDLFYMLGPGSRIAIINLSVSKEQAKDVIFAEFLARLQNSRWFKGKYQAWTSKARFPKRVYAFSGGSTAISYYGYHTILGSLDEASFLVDRQDRSVAEELSEALLKSLNTRFPNAYKLFVISTLRSADDYLNTQIQRLKDEGVRVR